MAADDPAFARRGGFPLECFLFDVLMLDGFPLDDLAPGGFLHDGAPLDGW